MSGEGKKRKEEKVGWEQIESKKAGSVSGNMCRMMEKVSGQIQGMLNENDELKRSSLEVGMEWSLKDVPSVVWECWMGTYRHRKTKTGGWQEKQLLLIFSVCEVSNRIRSQI